MLTVDWCTGYSSAGRDCIIGTTARLKQVIKSILVGEFGYNPSVLTTH